MAKDKKNISNRLTILQETFRRKDIADYQSAINQTLSKQPRWIKLQELYNSLMLDAHLTSQIELRRNKTLCQTFALRSGDKDIELSAELRNLIYSAIGHVLDSVMYGYSLVELDPSTLSLTLLDRRNIDPKNKLLYLNPLYGESLDYTTLREYNSTLFDFVSSPLGLLSKAAPHVLFKRFAQSCWSEYCEIYGMPPRYIKTNTNDKELVDYYRDMLANIGSGASYVLDLDDDMGFASITATGGDVYERLIALCKEELSLLICGAQVGQDTTYGSNAKEQSSQELLTSVVEQDQEFVQNCLNTKLLPALSALNLLPQDAVFSYPQQEDTNKLFDKTIKAAAYFDIDPKWFKDKFGIEVTAAKSTQSSQLQALKAEDIDFFA